MSVQNESSQNYKIESFEIVLSRPLPHLELEDTPGLEYRMLKIGSQDIYLDRLRSLMDTAKD